MRMRRTHIPIWALFCLTPSLFFRWHHSFYSPYFFNGLRSCMSFPNHRLGEKTLLGPLKTGAHLLIANLNWIVIVNQSLSLYSFCKQGGESSLAPLDYAQSPLVSTQQSVIRAEVKNTSWNQPTKKANPLCLKKMHSLSNLLNHQVIKTMRKKSGELYPPPS